MSARRSEELLRALQQRLADIGIHAFFPATDNHITLNVYADAGTVAVQVGSSEVDHESFSWRDLSGKIHMEPPLQTVAWLRDFAGG